MKASNIFRKPSFLKGFARTFDLFGTLDHYKYSNNSDSEQIKQDWQIVGVDLKESLENYGKSTYR